MASLAERRAKLELSAVKTDRARKIVKLEAGDSIEKHYRIEGCSKSGHGLCKALLPEGTEVKENEPTEFVARVISKGMFSAHVDPSKLNEFDWRSTVENIIDHGEQSNVLAFHELLEDDEHYYLIMEQTAPPDFINKLLYERDISEDDAKRLVRHLLQALDKLHTRGMVHRAVSPDTILFRGQSEEKNELVLMPNENLTVEEPTSPKLNVDPCGTAASLFHAPERYLGEFSQSSDLWSVGMFLYILICGEPPFPHSVGQDKSKSPADNFKALQEAVEAINWDGDPWPDFPMARDLCKGLLVAQPKARTPCSAKALEHPWLNA